MIGVSPWHWWADATPERKATLIVSPGTIVSREPSVSTAASLSTTKTGGLQPWAAKTFEPETRRYRSEDLRKGLRTFATLESQHALAAMHEVTKPFNSIPANRQVADDYAIVMGSSHAEPMLRNNVGEWKADKNALQLRHKSRRL
jgi:hypothetical protein